MEYKHQMEEDRIRKLIREEHPDIAKYEVCTFDDLIKEFPQYRRQMITGNIKVLLVQCPDCGTRMPEEVKEKHKKYCKVNRVANQAKIDEASNPKKEKDE